MKKNEIIKFKNLKKNKYAIKKHNNNNKNCINKKLNKIFLIKKFLYK